MKRSTTFRITTIAMLTALSLVFNIFSISPSNVLKISFIMIPCMLAGLWFGPIDGFIVGAMGDFLGWLMHPDGAWLPLITLACGLLGLIPGFIRYLKINCYLKIIISTVICLIICTSGLNTFALWLVYASGKKTFWVYLWARLPWQSLVAAGNCILICILYPLLTKALKKYGIKDDTSLKKTDQVKAETSDAQIDEPIVKTENGQK